MYANKMCDFYFVLSRREPYLLITQVLGSVVTCRHPPGRRRLKESQEYFLLILMTINIDLPFCSVKNCVN